MIDKNHGEAQRIKAFSPSVALLGRRNDRIENKGNCAANKTVASSPAGDDARRLYVRIKNQRI